MVGAPTMKYIFYLTLLYLSLVRGSNGTIPAKTSQAERRPGEFEGCQRDGRCICQTASSISPEQFLDALSRLEIMETMLVELGYQEFYQTMVNLTDRLREMEQGRNSEFTSQELTDIGQGLIGLSQRIVNQRHNGTTREQLASAEAEIIQLQKVINSLRRETFPVEEQLDESFPMYSQQGECTKRGLGANLNFFPGDSMPLPANESSFQEDWCDLYEVEGLGEPVTHQWLSDEDIGVWLKDPVPTTEEARTNIFIHNGRQILKYSNYSSFLKKEEIPMPYLMYYSVHKTNPFTSIVYNGSLLAFTDEDSIQIIRLTYDRYSRYYDRYNSQSMYKNAASQIDYMEQNNSVSVEFKADELGLWVVYASRENLNRLVISKIDPFSMKPLRTHWTHKLKATVCASFMACGTLYTLDICDAPIAPSTGHTQYTYDTVTGQERHIRLAVTSKYGQLSWVSYNAREKMLFGLDNGHLVTYPLKWRPKY